MYIKTKCCFLKDGIDPKNLERYGFVTLNKGESYYKDINDNSCSCLMWYKETRRFVYKYPKKTSYRSIRKYLTRLLRDDLIEVKPMYEWLTIIGNYHNFSYEKRHFIEANVERKNKKLWKKLQNKSK